MTRTLTNNVNVSFALESSIGTLPGSPTWYNLEPNSISKLGADIEKVARNPISANRQMRKGAIVGLTSGFAFEADVTYEHYNYFLEGFSFAVAKGGRVVLPTSVSTTAYTVPAMSGALPSGTVVYARGFVQSTNNGMKVVTTGGTTTSIPITGGGMTAETTTATQNARVEVAGVQGAAGDIQINSSGNLISTTLDFTTLSLTVGQWIYVGGAAAATNFASLTATTARYARITAIAANVLSLDKRGTTFSTDTGATKTIHLYFGRFVRNVPVNHADYRELSFAFEVLFNDLNTSPGVDEYEYPSGNLCDELTFDLELKKLAIMNFGFVGTDTQPPSTTRKTNAANALVPVANSAYSTTSDIARLRLNEFDDTGISTDFKSLKLSLKNNVSAEDKLALLGAAYMNEGNYKVSFDATMIFTNSRVAAAMRDNSTLSFDMALKNGDGSLVCDIPELTLSGGARKFPENESVNIDATGMAHQSAVFGFSLGFSIFPFLPTS